MKVNICTKEKMNNKFNIKFKDVIIENKINDLKLMTQEMKSRCSAT